MQIFQSLSYYRIWFLGAVVSGLVLDIFIFDFTSDLVILFLVGLWILVVRLYEYEGRISIGIGMGFLIVCPFLLIFKVDAIAEKAAIWAFMFLLVGVGRQVTECFGEQK